MTTARELAEQLEAIWMSHRFELSDNAMERTEALLQPLVLDAERYRWLRDEGQYARRDTPTVLSECPMDKEALMLIGKALDQAIDQARSES